MLFMRIVIKIDFLYLKTNLLYINMEELREESIIRINEYVKDDIKSIEIETPNDRAYLQEGVVGIE